MELIFLKPVLKDKIWGGRKLREELLMKTESNHVGEAWLISAHKNGITEVASPEWLKGKGLDEIFTTNPEIFNSKIDGNDSLSVDKKFPLLIKLIDASDNLSVQVHPDDDFASKHEGRDELGKTECWYIVSADEGAEIVYGHNAKTRLELAQMCESGKWDDLLRRVEVKEGDFFYVPHGTVHAIGKGIVILEVQQSSDTTYRVYDYDRVDDYGNKRELHIEKSIEVSNIPGDAPKLEYAVKEIGKNTITDFLKTKFFSVSKYDCKDRLKVSLEDGYYLMNVIKGDGKIILNGHEYKVNLADSFIVPAGEKSFEIVGNMCIISTHK